LTHQHSRFTFWLDAVDHVEWRLHPTFPGPIRRVKDRASGLRLGMAGRGVLPIHASISLKMGEIRELRQSLQLHYPDRSATTARHRHRATEEIVDANT
jgi:hypothetical protein